MILKLGVFTRRVSRGNAASGSVAGCPDKDGYLVAEIGGRKYKLHRLAWLFMYGYLPETEIDHKNNIPDDNRISNLREATKFQNLANAKARGRNPKGASWHKRIKLWQAQIMKNNKKICLGYFQTALGAHAAYAAASQQLNGEFARLN